MLRSTRTAAPPRPTRETSGGTKRGPEHLRARGQAPPARRRPPGSRRTGRSRAATDAWKPRKLRRPGPALLLRPQLRLRQPVAQAIRGRFALVRRWRAARGAADRGPTILSTEFREDQPYHITNRHRVGTAQVC